MGTKTVYIHGWETVGGVSFDWFPRMEDAEQSYKSAPHHMDRADFLTSYETEADETADETTDAIDAEIDGVLAKASTRRVGSNILAYWNENGMKMGTATEPAKD